MGCIHDPTDPTIRAIRIGTLGLPCYRAVYKNPVVMAGYHSPVTTHSRWQPTPSASPQARAGAQVLVAVTLQRVAAEEIFYAIRNDSVADNSA